MLPGTKKILPGSQEMLLGTQEFLNAIQEMLSGTQKILLFTKETLSYTKGMVPGTPKTICINLKILPGSTKNKLFLESNPLPIVGVSIQQSTVSRAEDLLSHSVLQLIVRRILGGGVLTVLNYRTIMNM